MMKIHSWLFLYFGLFLCQSFVFSAVSQAEIMKVDQSQPVFFKAEKIIHDNDKQTISARGMVEIIQDKQTVKADEILYNLETDTVSALGNVRVSDAQGNIYTAEYVELTKDMKDGFVHGLKAHLSDGSQFSASEAQRIDNNITKMKDASYTPCKICPGKKPLWQLVADEVVHDDKENTIQYKNARVEILGLPIVYTPIFSHPDPDQKRKSGFLRPSGGWTSERGTFAEFKYYYAYRPDMDATLTVEPTTRAGTRFGIDGRKRFEKGELNIETSAARSDRISASGLNEGVRTRGHIFADGRYDINEKWRAGFSAERASDKEYLNLYDISDADVLETKLYTERFSGRNYANITAYNFQDIRIGARPDQPDVIPSAEVSFMGEPNQLWGGRWSFDAGMLGLNRQGAGQDVYRVSSKMGYQKKWLSDTGLVSTFESYARADGFRVDDSLTSDNQTENRLYPEAIVKTALPMVKPTSKGQLVIEPVVSLAAAPNLDQNSLPNEDSLDIEFDSSNLFADNRFTGLDRVDEGVRVTYGSSVGYYDFAGLYMSAFLGQIYRMTDDNPYAAGSGLDDDLSDVVGKFDIHTGDYLDFSYRYQLNDETLKAQRHDIAALADFGQVKLHSNYIYARPVTGTGITDNREQLRFGGRVAFNPYWSLDADSLTDLGNNNQSGLRKAYLGLHFRNECLEFGIMGQKNLTNRTTGENDTTILLRLGLKNLGDISTPEILLRSEDTNP